MRAKQGGFTLLEVIIAIAIFAAMYLFAQFSFTQALDNRAMLTEHAQLKEERQRLLLILSQDIEQLIARPVRDGFGDLQPALMGDEEHLTFTRLGWSNVLDLRQRSQMQRVSYAFEEEHLVRYHWPYLDQTVDMEPVRTVVADKVEEVRWRYLMRGANNKWEWQELWPPLSMENLPPLQQPLPQSIELTLTFTEGEELHRFFRTVSNPWEQP